MNIVFILPLTAAIVLFSLVIVTLRGFLKTRLITIGIFVIFPILFGVALVNQSIFLITTDYIDLYLLTNLCYILGSIMFFYAGGLTISQLFLDEYTPIYTDALGWTVIPNNILHYLFFILFVFLAVFVFLGVYLFRLYKSNVGKKKTIFRRILITFLITGAGVGIFTVARSLQITQNAVISNLDSVCVMIGFGYLIRSYLKNTAMFHLDMVNLKLYGLFVFDKSSGILLYHYEFETDKIKGKELFGGLFKGIDSFFKEILKSDQQLKEVIHGSNYVLFNQGKDITVGLFANISTLLVSNWLYRFRSEFERIYSKDISQFLKDSNVEFEDKPDELVKRIFLSDTA